MASSKEETSYSKALEQISRDPYKEAVASPLSKFLASQIGTGIGQFPVDEQLIARYNDLMGLNASEYFDKNVAEPSYKLFNKYARPLITEGFAGNLRGSGRFGAEEAGFVELGEKLATTKAGFVPDFTQKQVTTGTDFFKTMYENWYKSLPVNNPALAQAVGFLSSGSALSIMSSTETGTSTTKKTSSNFDWASELAGLAGVVFGPSLSQYGESLAESLK